MIFTIMALLVSFFIVSNHPIPLVIVLIMQTICTLMIPVNLQENNWLSFILFLIFLGGLLIIFVYLSALIPNEMMKTSKLYFLMIFVVIAMISSTNYNLLGETKMNSMTTMFIFNMNFMSTLIQWLLVYLFSCLCFVMLMCSFMKSPMKQEIV